MFPTYVGVNRRALPSVNGRIMFPTYVGVNRWGTKLSFKPFMFPTYVGVNRGAKSGMSNSAHVPHVCGGEPDDPGYYFGGK